MTDTSRISLEIARFLKSDEPEVLCITGKWGVGKTYTWRKYLLEAQAKNDIGLNRYAYVSLFGQNSLRDFKAAIFEGTVDVGSIECDPDFRSLDTGVKTAKNYVRKKAYEVGSVIPYVKDYIETGRAFFFAVRNQIICVDDLERAGKELSTKNILGMVSFLREERGCKVIVILNQEELTQENREEFNQQLEKVIDLKLEFKPTSEEAAKIGLKPNLIFNEHLTACIEKLGITNLRVIKKIERICETLAEHLKDHDADVLKQAVHTATLLGWIIFQPAEAPPIELVRASNPWEDVFEKKEVSDKEKAWRALLKSYEFSNADEFDLAIFEGIRAGYFDDELLKKSAGIVSAQIEHQRLDNSFSAAWNLYHDSFSSSADEVLDIMAAAVHSSAKVITPINISATISLFKDLGRLDQAKEVLTDYMELRKDEARDFFDLGKSPFGSEVKDPDVRAAFKQKLSSFKEDRDAKTILINIIRNSGWNPEDIDWLATITPEQFEKMFKENSGSETSTMIQAALKFGTYGDATASMKLVAANAADALRNIASESAINARRVRRYGILPTTTAKHIS